jgi:hypothetical protein
MTDERLSRMEDKLDKLSEAVVSMARIEERLTTVFKSMDKIDDLNTANDARMDDLALESMKRGQKIAFAERIFWMILTGAVGLCFVYLR